MIHDMFCTIFYEYDQYSIHPSKKLQIDYKGEIKGTGKIQKAFSKSVAEPYLSGLTKY
jgi:hypothetical protein